MSKREAETVENIFQLDPSQRWRLYRLDVCLLFHKADGIVASGLTDAMV